MLEKNPDETLGKYIERVRKSKGYSQRKLALVTGLSNTTISRIEKGGTEKPDAESLKLIAQHLGIDEIYILQLAGYIDNPSNKIDSTNNILTEKDEKDIAKKVENLKKELMESQGGLMFDGFPASPEAIESVLEALEFGIRQAKIINKKYTPKKYRKNTDI